MAEHQYLEYTYAFTSKGLAARFSFDRTPEGMYWNLLGLEVRQEQTISSRLGRIPITTVPLTDLNVHTLSRLKGISGNTYRFGGAGKNVYRISGDSPGTYAKVNGTTLLSGNRFSTFTYRPSFSSFPYIFFADSQVMLKDNGTFNPLQQMGIFPPFIPPTLQVAGFLDTPIDLFFEGGTSPVRSFANITASVVVNITSIVRAAGVVTVTTATPHNIQGFPPSNGGGQRTVIIANVLDPSFDGSFGISTITGTNSFQFLQSGPNAASSSGTATCFFPSLKFSTISPGALTGGKIVTITPSSMTNINPFMGFLITDGVHSETAFVISTTASNFTAYLANNYLAGANIFSTEMSGTVAASQTGTVTGQGLFNLDVLGAHPANDNDIITFYFNLSAVANVTSITLFFDVGDGSFTKDFYSATVTLTGYVNGTWAQFSSIRGSFIKNGNAGLPGKTWSNVNAYRVSVVTNATGSTSFQMSDLFFYNVGGPTILPAGSPFDYRYTYFNNQTGDESNPSVPMVTAAFVSPTGQTVIVNIVPSLDPQVTNINIYRRGGTLNVGWTFVAQIPGNSTSYSDGFLDSEIAGNPLVALDNDPPLTTTLPVPVNSFLGTAVTGGSTQVVTPASMANIFPNQLITVDSGNNQEVVIVQSTTSTTFTAYFQNAHGAGATIAASTRSGHAVNLATIAFDQAWLAGDGDNPNRLYFSKITNPEAFPPQNWIEIGTPSDPIMAVVFFRAQLFVLTQSRIYRVIIPFPGAVPAPYPTSSRHGLFANFGFCLSEGLIPYLSKDGIYIFQGDASNYATEVLEWLFADKEPNLGPVPEQDPAQAANTIMAFTKNDFYVSYLDKQGVQRRVAYDLKENRWRNDDVPATAMFYEEDTEELVIGRNNGMIYRDRRGDVDNEGASNQAINLVLETPTKDQGYPLNDKSYNELTLDFDSGGQALSVSLLFDNGTSVLPLGTFSSNGRSRVPIPINGGNGRVSQNVALFVTGAVTSVVHFYNWYIKAAIEAEYRESFDSYFTKFGTDEFKFVKQGWFEYTAPDPGGIYFLVYIEGDMTNPIYDFQLPQATVRTARRLRFPPVKAKVWRFVGISASKFQLYGESFVEWKSVTMAKGYNKENLGKMITAQGSV